MFEVLVREAAARFGLGDKALPLLQIVLYHMTRGGARGLAEFLEKFKEAGLGPTVQSWLGGGPVAKPISNEDLDKVLGSSDGLISTLTHKLELDRENVTSALGYLLPSLVGKLTPGGSLPSRIPPEVQALADEGKRRVEAPAARAPAAASSGGAMKWLPWVIVALAVILGLGYCSTRDKGDSAVAPAVEDSSAPAAPDSSDTTTPPATSTEPSGDALAPDATQDDDAITAEPSATDDATAQPGATDDASGDQGAVSAGTDDSGTSSDTAAPDDADGQSGDDAADAPDQEQDTTADADEPAATPNDAGDQPAGTSAEDESVQDAANSEEGEGTDEDAAPGDDDAGAPGATSSAVEASTVDGKPALKVFFESGDATVPAEFSEQAKDLLDYLKAHDEAKIQVSGFTDATGSAQFNEELAKKRANAVLAALVMNGVEESQVTLAKPQKVSGDDAGSQPTSRRVEVTVVDAE